MKKLYLYGVLEIDGDLNTTTGSYKDFVLSAEYIYIVGGRLIAGWPDNPFKGNVDVILRGSHESPRLEVLGGPEVGAKAIGMTWFIYDFFGGEVRVWIGGLYVKLGVHGTVVFLSSWAEVGERMKGRR